MRFLWLTIAIGVLVSACGPGIELFDNTSACPVPAYAILVQATVGNLPVKNADCSVSVDASSTDSLLFLATDVNPAATMTIVAHFDAINAFIYPLLFGTHLGSNFDAWEAQYTLSPPNLNFGGLCFTSACTGGAMGGGVSFTGTFSVGTTYTLITQITKSATPNDMFAVWATPDTPTTLPAGDFSSADAGNQSLGTELGVTLSGATIESVTIQ